MVKTTPFKAQSYKTQLLIWSYIRLCNRCTLVCFSRSQKRLTKLTNQKTILIEIISLPSICARIFNEKNYNAQYVPTKMINLIAMS